MDNVQDLSDLELAALLCLIAGQHCIIQTQEDWLDEVEQELRLIASNVFGLSCAVLDCSKTTSLDDFGNGILIEEQLTGDLPTPSSSPFINESSYFQSRNSRSFSRQMLWPPRTDNFTDGRSIANIVIAKHLNLTDPHIQIQTLELLRGKRIFTRTSVRIAPKRFLFVALLPSTANGPLLVSHLNNQLFISHYHSPKEELLNLDQRTDIPFDDGDSSSILRGTVRIPARMLNRQPIFPETEVDKLVSLSQQVTISEDVRRYMQNVVTFLRLHRAIASGVSALATKHFELLVKCLAALHSFEFVTPSLVLLAARKLYPHRIAIVSPENERSMQWGSDCAAVSTILEGVSPEGIIEEVITMVEAPL